MTQVDGLDRYISEALQVIIHLFRLDFFSSYFNHDHEMIIFNHDHEMIILLWHV